MARVHPAGLAFSESGTNLRPAVLVLLLALLGACSSLLGIKPVADDPPAETCGVGYFLCGQACVDTMTDSSNCASCGVHCKPNEACSEGQCKQPCADGQISCGSTCVDPKTDAENCGACGTVCASLPHAATGSCTAGVCGVSQCPSGYADCDKNSVDGCESDSMTDAANCGACGQTCPAALNAKPTCTMGTCAVTCAPGFTSCAGSSCVNTMADGNNCGACGHACGANLVCYQGQCVGSCMGGASLCGNSCIDLDGDPNNCGACSASCDLPNVQINGCSRGTCSVGQCAAGFADCDAVASNGCETNTANDGNNCGSCGNDCPGVANATSRCGSGQCGFVCYSPFQDCDGDASNGCEVDTDNDPSNCGGCGNACSPDPVSVATCGGSTCGSSCLPATVGIDQSFNGISGAHFFTNDAAEASCCSWTVEAYNYFYLMPNGATGLVPLYRCYNASVDRHLLTTDPNCEVWGAATLERTLGFIATAAYCGAVPLYRMHRTASDDIFYTPSAGDHADALTAGYVDDFVAGYVWP